MLLLHQLEPWHWAVAGAAIGAISPGCSPGDSPLRVAPKPRHPRNLVGVAIFGVGWSLTGMCPGPIFVNVGEGELYALGALAGALVGAALFSTLYERLVPALRLPALKVGTGDG